MNSSIMFDCIWIHHLITPNTHEHLTQSSSIHIYIYIYILHNLCVCRHQTHTPIMFYIMILRRSIRHNSNKLVCSYIATTAMTRRCGIIVSGDVNAFVLSKSSFDSWSYNKIALDRTVAKISQVLISIWMYERLHHWCGKCYAQCHEFFYLNCRWHVCLQNEDFNDLTFRTFRF